MAVTIKDMAKALGLATSTISRALSDHPDISDRTKTLVIAKAKELNYRPNFAAIGLRTRKSNAIGILVPQITNPFFSAAIDGIQKVAHKHGYYVIICQSGDNNENEGNQIASLLSCQVEGIILSLSDEEKSADHLRMLEDRGVPFVFFDRAAEGFNAPKVEVDDFEGGYLATEHLIKNGRKNIAHLGGPHGLGISQRRYQGYLEALRVNGLSESTGFVGFSNSEGLACDTIDLMLSDSRNTPDAVFAFSDEIAIELMLKLKKSHIKVPRDLAVVGFGNNSLCEIIEPNLTSITQEPGAMGASAADLLFNTIRKEPLMEDESHITYQPRLVIRQSSLQC